MEEANVTSESPVKNQTKKIEEQIELLKKFPLGTYWAKKPYHVGNERNDLPLQYDYFSSETLTEEYGIKGERIQICEGGEYTIDRHGTIYNFTDDLREITKEEYQQIRKKVIDIYQFKNKLLIKNEYLFLFHFLQDGTNYKISFDTLVKTMKFEKEYFMKHHSKGNSNEERKFYLFCYDAKNKTFNEKRTNINLFEIDALSLSYEPFETSEYPFVKNDKDLHFCYKEWHLFLGSENYNSNYYESTLETLIHTPDNNWRYAEGDNVRRTIAYEREKSEKGETEYRNGGIISSLGDGELYFITREHFESIKNLILQQPC